MEMRRKLRFERARLKKKIFFKSECVGAKL